LTLFDASNIWDLKTLYELKRNMPSIKLFQIIAHQNYPGKQGSFDDFITGIVIPD
jgi:hypothetical protein